MKKHVAVVLVVLAGMIGAVAPAQALTFVSTRGGLGATDYVDWGVLGPVGTAVSPLFNILSAGGVSVTVSKLLTDTPFMRLDEGTSWRGNFAPGDALIWTVGQGIAGTNPVSVMDFGGVGIQAGGLQIQSVNFGSFTARVEAFDAADTSLGFFTAAGYSNLGDNSALFLGVSSDVPIHRLAFGLDAAYGGSINNFAVNRLDFVPAAIPEPITMAGLCLGLGGLTGYLRRRRA